MDSAVIIAIAGISGTLLAGLAGAALSHYFTERRVRGEIKRGHKERRLSPLIEFITDLVKLMFKAQIIEDKTELKTIGEEVLGLIKNRMWAQVIFSFGVDERLDDKILKFIKSAGEFTTAKSNEIKGDDSWDTERSKRIMVELTKEASDLVSLCYKILEER